VSIPYTFRLITLACLGLLCSQAVCAEDFGDSLVIVISGGLRGRVNGCGCSSGPEGGLDRRVTLFRGLFGDSQPVGLDCGAILDLDPEGGIARSRCMIAGLAREGLQVVGVSGRDLYYGAKFLKDAADRAGISLVSANLTEPNGGTPFPMWQTVSVNGSLIAVTSLCEPLPRMAAPGSISSTAPDSALKNLNNSVPPGVALRVLLTDMAEASLRSLLISTDLFDVALTCSRQVFSATPFQSGKCMVIHPEPDGRSLEVLTLPRAGPASQGRVIRLPVTRSTLSDQATLKWLEECLNTPRDK